MLIAIDRLQEVMNKHGQAVFPSYHNVIIPTLRVPPPTSTSFSGQRQCPVVSEKHRPTENGASEDYKVVLNDSEDGRAEGPVLTQVAQPPGTTKWHGPSDNYPQRDFSCRSWANHNVQELRIAPVNT